MDTVSFSTGVLSVIAYATRLKNIVTITIGGRDRPPSLAALLLEYETHIRILEECGRRLLSEIEWTPASAVSGLRLCQQHLEVFEPDTVTMLSLHTAGRGVKILTGKVKEYVREKTKDGMRSFNGAVQLFRKIVKDAISQCRASNAGAVTIKHVLDTTQDLDSIKQMLGVHRSEMLSLLASKDITAKFNFETIFTDKPTGYYCTHGKCGYQSQEATREVALYLTKGLFEFDAKLLHPEQDSPPSQHYHVRAKLTVSSGVSIISKDVLDRAELSGGVVPYTDNETSFKLFGGEPIKPLGSVGIAWTARNSAKSWTTDFLVFEKTPVEFMLGKDFVLAEGLFVFGDSARATAKLAPLTGKERAATNGKVMTEKGNPE